LNISASKATACGTRPTAISLELAKKEMAQIGLVTAADVVDACVVRQPKAYPVYDEEYRDNISAIRRDREGSYPTLHMVGRKGAPQVIQHSTVSPKSSFRKYSNLRDKISFWLALTRDHASCHVFQPLVTPSGRRRQVDGVEDGIGVPTRHEKQKR
jgi:hypothetical protein